MIVFNEKDFVIRFAKEEDVDTCVRIFENWNVVKWLLPVPFPYTKDQAQKYFSKVFEANKLGRPFYFVIADKISDEMIGCVTLSYEDKKIVFGYWLDQSYWGRGIMSRAALVVIQWCIKSYNYTHIIADVDPINIASKRVLEKCGFKLQGTFPRNKISTLRGPEQMNVYLYADQTQQ